MDSVKNTFISANHELSKEIYQAFYGSSVINRLEYSVSKADFHNNPLYQEIVVNIDHYTHFYFHLGYQLYHDDQGKYYYIKAITTNESCEEDFDEISLKILAVLTIISRLATTRGQALSTLGLPVRGITVNDLDSLNEDEPLSIFKSLKFKSSEDAIDFLRKRGFAFKVDGKRYVLSHGSLVLIEMLINRQKEISSL
ncbi:hypothetical protein O1B16_002329 [Vibrio cholerae]|nr:hypothetical protein [Vibrio cholerae]ELJ8497366.1 hypothetical protein [Vibrio cholerae]HEJ2462531.1 hypothetical protein [Vibrio cholerae]